MILINKKATAFWRAAGEESQCRIGSSGQEQEELQGNCFVHAPRTPPTMNQGPWNSCRMW